MSLINLFRKKNKTSLFTTPSHSQKFFIMSKFRQFYKFDISETDTHDPQTALLKAEEKAKRIYKVKTSTHFLTNGSTSGVIGAVLSCVEKNDKVLICSNSHPCHLNAVKLAGGIPIFYDAEFDEEFGIIKPIDVDYLLKLINENSPKAVIVASPTYEGVVSDIKRIKEICTNAYLIVDEAHGALYPFSDELPESAINTADFVIQSLHKTAGGLNPTALLHNNSDKNTTESLKLINTTSPSYPLLASIEANINFLNSKKGRCKISQLIKNIKDLKENCKNVEFYDGDITKIVVKINGLSGNELSEKLFKEFCIEDEKNNEKSVMLLCGIGTDLNKIKRLEYALKKLSNVSFL